MRLRGSNRGARRGWVGERCINGRGRGWKAFLGGEGGVVLGGICINIMDGWVGMGDLVGRRMLHGGMGLYNRHAR